MSCHHYLMHVTCCILTSLITSQDLVMILVILVIVSNRVLPMWCVCYLQDPPRYNMGWPRNKHLFPYPQDQSTLCRHHIRCYPHRVSCGKLTRHRVYHKASCRLLLTRYLPVSVVSSVVSFLWIPSSGQVASLHDPPRAEPTSWSGPFEITALY